MNPDIPHPAFNLFVLFPPLWLLLALPPSVLELVPKAFGKVRVVVVDVRVCDGRVDNCVAAAGVGLENVSEKELKLALALNESVS